MKIDRNNKQVPNILVYGVLYALVFGISIWLLVFNNESPTNWTLYPAMAVSVFAGVVKFVLHSRKTHQRSA